MISQRALNLYSIRDELIRARRFYQQSISTEAYKSASNKLLVDINLFVHNSFFSAAANLWANYFRYAEKLRHDRDYDSLVYETLNMSAMKLPINFTVGGSRQTFDLSLMEWLLLMSACAKDVQDTDDISFYLRFRNGELMSVEAESASLGAACLHIVHISEVLVNLLLSWPISKELRIFYDVFLVTWENVDRWTSVPDMIKNPKYYTGNYDLVWASYLSLLDSSPWRQETQNLFEVKTLMSKTNMELYPFHQISDSEWNDFWSTTRVLETIYNLRPYFFEIIYRIRTIHYRDKRGRNRTCSHYNMVRYILEHSTGCVSAIQLVDGDNWTNSSNPIISIAGTERLFTLNSLYNASLEAVNKFCAQYKYPYNHNALWARLKPSEIVIRAYLPKGRN